MMVTVLKSSPFRPSTSSKSSFSATGLRRNTIIMTSSALFLSLLLMIAWLQNQVVAVSTEELVELIRDLKGTDERIMRWDASEHTAERQTEGACEMMPEVAALLVKEKDDTRLRLGCEYATWCITDNPYQRAEFSKQEGIHKAVVKIVETGSPEASATACHLIYIASFANEKNHQGFYRAGAVQALADIITDKTAALPVQIMWAAAALQNMAASYCSTRHDGRCYWSWNGKDDHVTINTKKMELISDGSPVRMAALEIPNLIPMLQHWACQGPVPGPASDVNILPGENAVAGRDDTNPAIIPWAAVGALKNLALEKAARPMLEGPSMKCYCQLKDSYDWLEELKGNDLLLFLRPHDPCWNDEDYSVLCIDEIFLDREGYYCDGYEEADEEECNEKDIFTGKPASEKCCGCGGGTRFGKSHEEL